MAPLGALAGYLTGKAGIPDWLFAGVVIAVTVLVLSVMHVRYRRWRSKMAVEVLEEMLRREGR